LWNDPEALERKWIVKYPHPMIEEVGQVGLAFSFSVTPTRVQGRPLLVGMSRKSMIGALTGRPVAERLAGSLAAAVLAVERGARLVRVHDVASTVDALRVSWALHARRNVNLFG